MAISGDTVFEVRTTGSDNSGGGFVAGASGTDYSQQNAAQGSGINLTVDATTNTDVLPDGYTAAAGDVGNIVQITAGTGFTVGFYEIKSIQGTKWRLDRSPAAVGTSGGTWAMGGALASPGKAAAALAQGSLVYVESGTYLITSASTNVAGGCMSPTGGTSFIGYSTNRTPFNTDTKPILRFSGITSCTMFQGGGLYSVRNLELDGNGVTSGAGTASQYQQAYDCVGKNFTNGAFKGSAVNCVATGCSTQAAFQGNAYGCVAYSNSITGFSSTSPVVWMSCLSINNSGASSYGFGGSSGITAINCTAYGNGSHGFYFAGGAVSMMTVNCLSVSNGGYAFYMGGYNRFLKNCAYYNNTSGGIYDAGVGQVFNDGTIVLTGDPFTNAAGNDFSLNNTSGAGADLKNAGWPSVLPYGSTNNYPDIGAVRHQDPAAGGGGAALARIFGGF